MLAYQQGDSAAFEVLYRRHKDSVFNFLYRSCQDSATVEDLVHDAWISIIRSIETYKPRAKFKTYLYTVVHNKLIDHWRRNNRFSDTQEYDDTTLVEDASDTESLISDEETRLKLNQAISKLPQDQRDAFLLREEGFSQAEIANIVGAKSETVKSRLRYAGAQLRKSMQHGQPSAEAELPAHLAKGVKQ